MEFITQPWQHQLHALELSKNLQDMALLWEAGTGKSGALVNILRYKYQESGRLMRTVIFAPIVVLPNWRDEFKLHSKIDPKNIVVLNQNGKQRIEKLKAAVQENSERVAKIIVINYDALINKEIMGILKWWAPEILVADESHRCKNFQAKRSKLVCELASTAKHRYILSGTPILNSLQDIFMQYKILDGGETFGQNFYGFQAVFFEDANARWKHAQNYYPKWMPKPHTFDEFNRRIYKKATRVVKADCLDLPPLLKTRRQCPLSPEQNKAYNEMRDEYVAFIKNKRDEEKPHAVIAELAVTKALRMQQIVSGFVKDDLGQIVKFDDVPRLKVLEELLSDLIEEGHKVIVWAVFKENYKDIAKVCESLKVRYSELHGEVPQSKREGNIEAFRKDPEVKIMIANQASGGIGINLIEASYSVYFSKNFSLEQDIQSEARNYRGGSEIHSKITRIDLVAPGTIDELVLDALLSKQSISDQILEWRL